MSTGTKRKYTALLSTDVLDTVLEETPLSYTPIPHDYKAGEDQALPIWRIRLDILNDSRTSLGFDVNDEIVLGRGVNEQNIVNLNDYISDGAGVSRRHLMLRPTATNLFVIDLGSTNGTTRNGRSIGFNTPYILLNGDILTLGKLQIAVHIIDRPALQAGSRLDATLDLADAMSEIAKAITTQLDLESVLNQVAESAMTLTEAGETSIWLVDENSGELFLEAERGVEDAHIRRMRLPIDADTVAGQVMQTGQSIRASREPGGERIRLMTNYLVEAMVHVPISLGGVTFGVLAAAHRLPGRQFDERDERLLSAISDFAAIAIQNVRLYQATDQALESRVNELAALNELTRAVSSTLDLDKVYEVLVEQINKHWDVSAVRLYLRQAKGSVLAQPSSTIAAVTRDKGIAGKVACTGKPVVTNKAATHPDFDHQIDSFDETEPKSLLCIPLSVQNKVVGMLTLFNKKKGSFTKEDVTHLEQFANPVATAIQNAQLFTASEKQRAAIQQMAQVLPQPFLILDEEQTVLISNEAADSILETHREELYAGMNDSLGLTAEITLGDQVYLSSTQHLPGVGMIIIMQDITYVKQLEQGRSEFLHALSHDLKNPLMSLMGWTEILEKTMPEDAPGQQFLGEIKTTTDRMTAMINNLLQTISADSTLQLVEAPCHLEQIVSQIVEDCQGAALSKSIALQFQQQGNAYPIMADSTRVYHMVLNLVDNAIKYSPGETAVQVGLNYNGEAISIKVKDEGPGIPAQELPRLFDKFYRGSHTLSKPGTGVGLSVVKAVANAHGGDIRVQNRTRKGAEFAITLPSSLRVTEETPQLMNRKFS